MNTDLSETESGSKAGTAAISGFTTSIKEPDIAFFDVRKPPFELYGLYDPCNCPQFRRVPEITAAATSKNVINLTKEPAGGRVRFSTDSSYIAIKAEYNLITRNPSITLVASAGFDLYEDFDNNRGSKFIRAFTPVNDMKDGYEQIIRLGSNKMRHFTIYFPVRSFVKNLYIGLQSGADIKAGLSYCNTNAPIVIYGSSIVHGIGASRPGQTYPNILTRRLNMDVINLGFCGSAKAEDAIIDYCAGLNMSVFICDYDHNAPDDVYLRETHLKMYERFRKIKPDTPYIVISKPDIATHETEMSIKRRDVVYDTYRYAREHGDRNIRYIDGESFFLGRNQYDCTIDGVHPNDIGYLLMADSIECVLRDILRNIR